MFVIFNYEALFAVFVGYSFGAETNPKGSQSGFRQGLSATRFFVFAGFGACRRSFQAIDFDIGQFQHVLQLLNLVLKPVDCRVAFAAT
jgi:hypothetical protein